MLKTLKQIFQLESISCVYLHDSLKRLSAKICLDFHLYVCLDLLRVGSPSRIYAVERNVSACYHVYSTFKVADQSWQTGPNESVLHFEVVFVVC